MLIGLNVFIPSFLEVFVNITFEGGNGFMPRAANGGPVYDALWLCWYCGAVLLLISKLTVSPESLRTCTAVA